MHNGNQKTDRQSSIQADGRTDTQKQAYKTRKKKKINI